jgi:hypothetical protein
MFSNQSNIIIVDNNEQHIEILNRVFIDNFIRCRTFVYDSFHKIEHPLTDVRIAFFDINLRDLPTSNSGEIFNELANALNEYISPTNGPFALVFWTQNEALIPDFINYINTRRPLTPKPYNLNSIDKDNFLELAREDLQTTLELIFEQPSINLLFEFENKVKESATKTINKLYSIIPNNSWGNNNDFDDNFDKIFSKISASTLGIDHAKKNPDKAVYESLLPILNHNIINTNVKESWAETLKSLKVARSIENIKIPHGFNESIINSIFHIDESITPFPYDTRGAVILMDKDDKNFETDFGIKFESWFTSFLPISDSKTRKDIRSTSKLVAIEISSSCDYSQNKGRINKYLLAVIIEPIKKEDLKYLPECNLFIANFYRDIEFQIWANLNYTISSTPNSDKFINSEFILKKEIMDFIGNRYANHVSRIGITSF